MRQAPSSLYKPQSPEQIVSTDETVLLVGGGDLRPGELKQFLSPEYKVIAADGGARPILAEGAVPEIVIGDMDSVPADPRLKDRLFHIAEQDSTDFSKAVSRIAAPLILALGFGGGRLDHQLSVLTVLTHYPDRRVIALMSDSLVFLAPPRITLPVEPGALVSLFPMAPVEAQSTGLRWPLDGLVLAPDGQVGTSNEATGPVTLTPEDPRLLIILPRDDLALARAALSAAPEAWPSRQ